MKHLCSSLATLAVLGSAAITHAAPQTPFTSTGVATGRVESVVGNEETLFFNLSLRSTRMGPTTGTATFIVTLPDLTFTGSFCLTGINHRDILCFSATNGQLTPVEPGSCVFDFTMDVTVTSGSGAFAGATGSGTNTGQFNACDPNALFATPTLEATISVPHGK